MLRWDHRGNKIIDICFLGLWMGHRSLYSTVNGVTQHEHRVGNNVLCNHRTLLPDVHAAYGNAVSGFVFFLWSKVCEL